MTLDLFNLFFGIGLVAFNFVVMKKKGENMFSAIGLLCGVVLIGMFFVSLL